MAAAPLAKEKASGQKDREGVVAVVQDQSTLDAIQGALRDMRLDDRLEFETTLDGALQRLRSGNAPRVLVLDVTDSTAPIAEISAARNTGGNDFKIVAIGAVNDVALFRDLLSAGANDYLVKPASREALGAAFVKRTMNSDGGGDELGRIIAFIGSRGGVGTTTTAVSCAWLLAEKHQERTVLLDLDLHFGTVALHLDTDPGNGLCEALEQPSRIDSLFIERSMIKVTDRLGILAAEAAISDTLMVDAGAIDVLLYELRRKFSWVLVDLPRAVTPTQRVVLGSASRVVLLCERSLAGLRDTIRLQTLVREHASQAEILLIEGACGERGGVGKPEFEKAVGKSLDGVLPYDAKSTAAAANVGKPLPEAAPRSPVVREIEKVTNMIAGPAAAPKRRLFGLMRA
jgi:pilus assembly protein CpaE